MTVLHYYIADPTKNITALVETPVPPASRPFAAARIMEAEPSCEQVGFLSFGKAGERCLTMAGGEFCGNAAMSAAALACREEGLAVGQTGTVALTVSGAPEAVSVHVTAQPDGSFLTSVRMPPVERIGTVELPLKGRLASLPAVYLPGIVHIMITRDELDAGTAEEVAREWCRQLGAPCLGLMLFDRERPALRPLVCVPGADTLVWESSCASGTAALGAFLADESQKETALRVAEPGGTLFVQAAPYGEAVLTGQVMIVRKAQILVYIG